MNITANTLFHFTDSRKNIENILETRFHPTYCKETIQFEAVIEDFYFPMVSFCDIPLFLSKNHIGKYGNYGIGMSKQWGIKNRLNPVLYIEDNSSIAQEINESYNNLKELTDELQALVDKIKNDKDNPLYKNILSTIEKVLPYSNFSFRLIQFVKNYQGDLVRKNKTINNYRFYDEREWRFIPKLSDESIKWNLKEDEFAKYRGSGSQKPLLSNVTLDFSASDIKFLIVKSESDIPKLMRRISSIDNLARNADEIDVLFTKILTVEQLTYDF